MSFDLIEFFSPYLEWLVALLDILAIVLLLWGVFLFIKDFLYFSIKKRRKEVRINENNGLKKMLGGYILLSLEILISSGIIESIIKPTLQDVFQLVALVVIRTIISYFLNKEIVPADLSE